jgi:hypothetical protein
MTEAKRADPLAAMEETFGRSITNDAVKLVGLAPTPVERGGERFDQQFEIVDLGRNRHRARLALARLREEAAKETRLQDLLKKDLEDSLRKFWEEQIASRDSRRKSFCGTIEDRGFEHAVCYDRANDLISDEVAGGHGDEVLKEIKRDGERWTHYETCKVEHDAGRSTVVPPEPGIDPRRIAYTHSKAVFDKLEKKLLGFDPPSGYHNDWDSAVSLARYKGYAALYRELKDKIGLYHEQDKARVEIERRHVLRRTPIDALLPQGVGEITRETPHPVEMIGPTR